MKILGLSDLHGNLLNKIPECDILCICGDTIELNIQRDMQRSEHWWKTKFIDWCKKLPCKKVIIIAGNHDFYWEHVYKNDTYEEFKNDLLTRSGEKVICLLDESYTYDGVVFYGTPWIKPITFQENVWAFSSEKYWENIPCCDILLTHDSPIVNDNLNWYSQCSKCKYHLFGHWHDGTSNHTTRQLNCSRLDDWYKFKKNYEYVIVDVMTETEKKKVEQDFLQRIINDVNALNELSECLTSFLNKYKDPILSQDIEDEIEWDTSADVLESALITDIQ